MNILVVGGAGYIGGVVAQQLVEAGHEVFVFDNLVKGHHQAVPEQARFISGDLVNMDDINQALDLAQADAVFHFAALIEAGESMKKPALYFRANVSNTLNLLESCVTHNVTRMVFSSTAAVFAASDAPLTEMSPIQPANCYGETKLMVEQMLRWFNSVHGLRYGVLRYFNACGAYGPRGEAHTPETHLIPLTLQAATGQRPYITVYGTDYPTPDGTCIRDYIHVEDLADAHARALDHLLAGGASVRCNLGTGVGVTVKQIISAVEEVTGKTVPVKLAARREGDPDSLVADPSLAKELLGWEASHKDVRDMVRPAWLWINGPQQGRFPANKQAP